MNYVIRMTDINHVIYMRYTDYVIRKNKKHLRIFLEFYFNVGCTNNVPGAPSKAPWATKLNSRESEGEKSGPILY